MGEHDVDDAAAGSMGALSAATSRAQAMASPSDDPGRDLQKAAATPRRYLVFTAS